MAPRRNRGPNAQQSGSEPVINGPRSALTSFLHEQGITGPAAIPNYSRRPAPPSPAPTASTSNSTAPTTPVDSTAANSDVSTSASVAPTSTGATKRKAPTAAQTAAALKKKKAEEHDEHFKIAGKGEGPTKKGKYENRTPGAISVCSECGKRFTVTKYTPTNPSGRGLLCSPCTSESIEDLASGAVFKAPPKPKPVKKKAVKGPDDRHVRPIKTLLSTAIQVIGAHINNVEALGDIGAKNLDRVAQIVCRNRALSGENLNLFLEIGHTELRLYDCTNLKDHELSSIATFCPRLERLTLNFCGTLDDDVLKAWGKGFKSLKYLSLYAPYLVTFGQWKEYLGTFGGDHQLEGFGLRQSARFDDDCIKLLVDRNPGLFNLQLSEIGKLNDGSLTLLHGLKNLTTLDISRAGVNQGNVLTDEAVVALIENVGENLVELVLDQNYLLTDRVLLEGVKIHCPRLTHLSLHSLSHIQSTGLQSLFTDWVNPGLSRLTLHRVLQAENEAIEAVVTHSGHSLQFLDLHSVDELDESALMKVAEVCPRMEELDLSFVRMTDNFVIKKCLDEMPNLRKLFVHGNNRVTSDCPQRRGCSVRGLENAVAIEL